MDASGIAYGRFTSDGVNCEVCADGTRRLAIIPAVCRARLGTAGNRGTCEPCVNDVTDGVTIGKHSPDRIVCEACPDGKEPNVMHTDCTVCPAGHNWCEWCVRPVHQWLGTVGDTDGMPDVQRSERVRPGEPQLGERHGSRGVRGLRGCGRAADATNSECDVCPPGRYSSDGVTCSFCPGEEPNIVEFSVARHTALSA